MSVTSQLVYDPPPERPRETPGYVDMVPTSFCATEHAPMKVDGYPSRPTSDAKVYRLLQYYVHVVGPWVGQ